MVSDERFSSVFTYYLYMQEGGPIGLVENGDIITIDIGKKRIDTQVSAEEMNARRKKWTAPAYKVNRGVLYKVLSMKPLLVMYVSLCLICWIIC